MNPATKKQEETGIRKSLKSYLLAMGFLVETNFQGLGAVRGRPDLNASRDGKTLWIEVKTPRKTSKQFEHQSIYQSKVEAVGGIYLVIRSLEEMEQMLIQHGFKLKGQIKMFYSNV